LEIISSFFDVILTYPILPGRVAYIAKDDLVQVPVLPLLDETFGLSFLKKGMISARA